MKKITLALLFLLAAASLTACQTQTPPEVPDPELWQSYAENQKVVPAKILSVDSFSAGAEGQNIETTLFTFEITQGELKGLVLPGQMVVYTFMGYRAQALKAGARVFIQPAYDEFDQPLGEFADYDRTAGLVVLIVLFAAVLCVFGKMKGFRSLVALAATCAGLAFIFIPMVLRGASPVGASLLICALVSLVTLVIICGFNVKTASSLLGILIGLSVSGILVVIFQRVMYMTGLVDSEAIRLITMPGMENLNLNGLMFAAILVGASGACMDMAVSLASALEELNQKSGLHGVEMVKSGMRIGGDMMGTMTNTLVLAYVGGSLHLVLLLAMDLTQFGYIVSWEILATEVLRAFAGSIGLIVIVPATAVICALLYRRKAGDPNPFA